MNIQRWTSNFQCWIKIWKPDSGFCLRETRLAPLRRDAGPSEGRNCFISAVMQIYEI